MTSSNIILASASPRRTELLSQIYGSFRVIPSELTEEMNESLTPEENAVRLAEMKCDDVFSKFPDKVVIGCDTIVALGVSMFGKPSDRKAAHDCLKILSGKTHRVITGVCVRSPRGKRIESAVTEVRIRTMADEEIEWYIDNYAPLDKAGAYGIQDGYIVKEYHGSYTNVMGLPVALVRKLVEELS